jgi:hypothetical protein
MLKSSSDMVLTSVLTIKKMPGISRQVPIICEMTMPDSVMGTFILLSAIKKQHSHRKESVVLINTIMEDALI